MQTICTSLQTDNHTNTSSRFPTVVFPKPNSLTFPLNHTTFSDKYCHTFQYWKHRIIFNIGSKIILACRFYNLKQFCIWIFNLLFIHTFKYCLKLGIISTIRSITRTFSTQQCAIPYFSLTFHVIYHFPTFPDKSNSDIFQFSWHVGSLPVFTGRVFFLTTKQQCQSTAGNR